MNQENFIVTTKNLTKEFDKKIILNHITLEVKEGEIFGILGANGAGKTTLLKLIAGLLEPTEGGCLVFGKDPWTQRDQVLFNIGSLIETPVFYEHLSAYENLSIHLEYMGKESNINECLNLVGLSNVGEKAVSKFSLGMRQRLAIARCMSHHPKVLILDEPINGLDPILVKEMRELFIHLKNQGITILLSSHILGEVTQTVDRVAIITNGMVVEVSDMAALQAEHQDNMESYFIERMRGTQNV